MKSDFLGNLIERATNIDARPGDIQPQRASLFQPLSAPIRLDQQEQAVSQIDDMTDAGPRPARRHPITSRQMAFDAPNMNSANVARDGDIHSRPTLHRSSQAMVHHEQFTETDDRLLGEPKRISSRAFQRQADAANEAADVTIDTSITKQPVNSMPQPMAVTATKTDEGVSQPINSPPLSQTITTIIMASKQADAESQIETMSPARVMTQPTITPTIVPAPSASALSLPQAQLPLQTVLPPMPTIHVTIGRVEVRATPATPPKSTHAGRIARSMTLEDYLRERDGGKR